MRRNILFGVGLSGLLLLTGLTQTRTGGGGKSGAGGGGDTITSPNGTITVGGTATNTTLDVAANQRIRAFTMHFNMSDGSVIAGTITGCKRIEYAGTITNWNVYGNVSGSATLGVRSVAFASYTGTAGYSGYTDVTGGGTAPSLSSAVVNSSSTLTSWVTSVSANSIVCVQLSSPANVSTLDVVLQVNAS